MDFQERLRIAMAIKGYTLEKLAEKTGIASNTILNWKKGRTDPSFFGLKRVAEVLETSLDWLAWGETETKVKTIKAEVLSEADKMLSAYKTNVYIKGEELIIIPSTDYEQIFKELVGEDK